MTKVRAAVIRRPFCLCTSIRVSGGLWTHVHSSPLDSRWVSESGVLRAMSVCGDSEVGRLTLHVQSSSERLLMKFPSLMFLYLQWKYFLHIH